jgi:hypothetical protein
MGHDARMVGGARVFAIASIATASLFVAGCGGAAPTARGDGDAGASTNGRARGPVTSLALADAYRKPLGPGETVPLARRGPVRVDRSAKSLPPADAAPEGQSPTYFGGADHLAVGKDGSLYASLDAKDAIVRVDPTGVASVLEDAGVPIRSGPLTVDPAGNLWVLSDGRLRKIGPDGAVSVVKDGILEPEANASFGAGDVVGKPFGSVPMPVDRIAVGADGTIVLLVSRAVLSIGPDDIVQDRFSGRPKPAVVDGGPPFDKGFVAAEDVEVLADGTIVVLDLSAGMVRALHPDGTLATRAGRSVRTVARHAGPLEDAWDLALAPDGSALVALRAPGKIMKVGPDGSVKEWASGLFSPDRIAVLADGTVAVRESGSVVRVAGR